MSTPSNLHLNMTSRIFLLLLVAVAMLIVLATASAQQPAFVTTTTGRRVPLAHLAHLATTDVVTRLYEVTNDLQLTGLDRTHDLGSLTTPWVLPPPDRLPTVTIDGASRPDVLEMQHGRRGSGYVVAHLADGPVVAVWGNGLALQPLDHATHPGLFVNLRPTQSDLHGGGRAYDLHNDTMYLPEKRGVNASNPILQPVTISSSTSNHMPTLPTGLRQPRGCNHRSPKKLEIAVAFDRELCEKYGNSEKATVTALRAMLSEAGAPYEAQTCVRFLVVLIEGSCNSRFDRYMKLSSVSDKLLLKAFRRIWQETHVGVSSDIAILIRGIELNTAISGLAWGRGACSPQNGYGWSIAKPIVISHEIAHLLGAGHSESGMMKPTWGPADPLRFSQESVDEIQTFVENGWDSFCLDEDAGDSDDGGNGGGTVTPPTTTADTCASSFSKDNALACVKNSTTIDVYDADNNVVGKTEMKRQQRNGQFWYLLIGKKSVRIRSVSIMASFDPSVTRADMPTEKQYGGGGRRSHRYQVDVGSLARPASVTSCCSQPYYTYVLINHCNEGDTCSSVFLVSNALAECKPCTKGSFIPMSAENNCPSCS